MILKVYQNYISKQFLLTFFKTILIFTALAFILNIFEEINFFKDLDVSIGLPIFLTFLNIPSILFEIFPFIFLIITLFFFIEVIEKDEINIFKIYGITNLKIIQILSLITFCIGFLILIFF